MSYTKGDWKIDKKEENPPLIVIKAQNEIICSFEDSTTSVEETLANADLICTSKKLLDVCKDMASILNGLYLGTIIEFKKVEHIRNIEKEARKIIGTADKKTLMGRR